MKNQINSKLQTHHKLHLLFLIFSSMVNAQNWTQLGRGNGGQVRALYLHNQNPNGGGPFNLYIGSDVAGVWKSANIASASALQLETNYQYNYISNSDIMRFTNKFYRPQRPLYTSDFLFVANYQGIHRIDLNSQDGNMLQVLDFPDSWVSDMYFCDIIGTNHAVYFTTGNTRVNDGIASNSKVNNVFDFYWGTLNQAENFINPQTLRGIKLEGMTANGDVYCLKVIDNNTPQISDDNYFIGSETGLWIFTNTDAVAAELLPNKTLVKLNHLSPNPDGTSNPYQVTSIIDAPTPGHYLVTISGGGIYEWNGSTWTSLGDDITLSEQSNTNTITYTGWNNVPGDAKLLNQILPVVVTNVLQGYILVNENFEMQNAPYYCGVYYCNKLNTTAWNWQSLSVTNAGNNWGWNSTLPAGNINSALLTPDNDLLIGKNGNLHITQNGDITQIANTDWEQIYTYRTNTSCNGTWQNKGFVNTVNAGLYLDGTILYGGEFDRGLMKSDVNYDFTWINKVGVNPCEHLLFNGSFSGCQNILPPAIVDCKYIAANNNTLYAAVAEGTSVNKGRGYIMKKPNGVTEWTQLGSTFCGDPVKIFFDAANNPYCIVNSTNPTQQSIYVLNGSIWQLCDIENGGGQLNDYIVDALIATEGAIEYIYFIKNANGKGVYKVEKITPLGTFSNSPPIAPILTTRVGKQLSIMPFGIGLFKLLIALKNNPNNPAANNFYESNSGLTSVTAINNCTTTNVPSDIFSSPGVDETQSGVTAIEVNNIATAIYAATLIEDPVTHKTHSHLYRTTYDNGTGAIGPCWSEITNNLPNKAINCIYPQTIPGTENIFTCIRGMGEWRNEICMAIHCTVTNPTTACISNGSATAVVDIGTAPYTYTWSNNQTNATATGLAAGTYTVTVTGSAGACTATASFTIAGLGAICTVTNSCTSGNGMATVATTGGTAPYTYSWSTSPPQSTNPATGLVAGTYTVTVTDANACTTTASCTVTPSTGIASITLANEGITCTGNDDGYTSVSTINGGVSPYTYLWSNGVTSALNNNVPTGTYTVTVTDAAGCTRTATTSVTQTAPNFASNIPPGNYFLNANVIISTPITVDHANIGIAPGVSITVNQGGVLNIANYSKLNACGDMWQGIINNGGTVKIENSTVEDAENATFSNTANSIFTITNSTFNKNYKNIVLQDIDFSSSSFLGNTFLCSTTLNTPHPQSYDVSESHFELTNVTGITIGGTNIIANQNIFRDANYAIYANNSSCDIENNRFINIGNNEPGVVQVYAAINGIESGTINTGNVNPNSFSNCATGVLMLGDVNSHMVNNTFAGCEYGVAVNHNYYGIARTVGNTFTNCEYAIQYFEISDGAQAYISNNTIIGGVDAGGTPINNVGIDFIQINKVYPIIEITENVISDYPICIFANYLSGNAAGRPLISDNTMNFNFDIAAAGSQNYTGLLAQRCNGMLVTRNVCAWPNGPTDPSTYTNNLEAFFFEYCINSHIGNNAAINTKTGIVMFDDCANTYLVCNTIDNCLPGIDLSGLIALPSHGTCYSLNNEWFGSNYTGGNASPYNKILGTAATPQIFWVYDVGTANDPAPFDPQTMINPVISSCVPQYSPCLTDDDDEYSMQSNYLGKIVGDSLTYEENAEENKYKSIDYAYQAMKQDSNLINNTAKQQFMTQTEQSNIGLLSEVSDSMTSGNALTASYINSVIVDTNLIEENAKTVNAIAITYLQTGAMSLLDTASLMYIAYQNPIYGGNAIYHARALLRLKIKDYYTSTARQKNNHNDNPITVENDFEIYPTPTNQWLFIKSNSSTSYIAALKIYDAQGKLTTAHTVNNFTKYMIDIAQYRQAIIA
nr:hypothetical protein [Bacteroidota bacterium]